MQRKVKPTVPLNDAFSKYQVQGVFYKLSNTSEECRTLMPDHNKVISGFQALRQARAPVASVEPTTEGSLQISGRNRKPLYLRRPR
ncbi:hypothetical protein PoB_002543300 [Plakobranchus ocellatus]|uniref:Uncharacterized protein n=1 Tax=Plakobranchus ocellatus TaxID=259542 RepID=A0AAV3ZVP5_9GAST|nr:hypothetical protein PoB_002543300 [Plakobranchus ocellatus]